LPLLAGENVSHNFVVPTVASSVDLVIHIVRDALGHRRVREIVAVPGRVEADVVEIAEVFVTHDDRLIRGEGWPPHPERYAAASVDVSSLLGLSAVAS
jgi:pilus assembly protein CpaF